MKESIVNILGKNHKHTIGFKETQEISGLYTYKGEIYCIHAGEDFPFENVSEAGKKKIHQAILDGKYKIDRTIQ